MENFLASLVRHKEGLGILGSAVVSIATGIWAVYRFRQEKKNKDAPVSPAASASGVSGQTVQIFGIPFAEFEALWRQREAQIRDEMAQSSPGRVRELEEELRRAELETRLRSEAAERLAELMSDVQKDMMPAELDVEVFPASLKVRSFVRGRALSVNGLTSIAYWVAVSIFGALFCGVFTLVLVALSVPPLLLPVAFVAVFVTLFTKYYVTFDFQKKRYKTVGPASVAWGPVQYAAVISTRKTSAGWIGEARFGTITMARTLPRDSELIARRELADFVRALNWALGIPVLSVEMTRK